MTPIYAGTFDPFTRGHLSVVKRMVAMFGKGVVLVAVNPDKTPLFYPKERCCLIRRSLIEAGLDGVVGIGYTTDYVMDWAVSLYTDPVLVRGIRKASETNYELAIADFNRNRVFEGKHGIETLFLPAASGMEDISSSVVRGLAENAVKGELLKYVTESVADALIERVQKPI